MNATEVHRLTSVDTGSWEISTSSGAVYLLDLDGMTSTRVAKPRSGPPTNDWPLAALRRDGETVPLLAFEAVFVGLPARLTLAAVDNYEGYRRTVRRSTPVVSIRRIKESS